MKALGFGSLGLFLVCLGVKMVYEASKPIVFDRRRGLFWKGKEPLTSPSRSEARDGLLPLSRLHALQLLTRGTKGGWVYQLNLVLEDAERIAVVCHGDGDSLREDVATLAEFLGVPVWDATGGEA